MKRSEIDKKAVALYSMRNLVILGSIIAGFVLLVIVYFLFLKQPSAEEYNQAHQDVDLVAENFDVIVASARESVDQTKQAGRLTGSEALSDAMRDYQQSVEKLTQSNVTQNGEVNSAMEAFAEDAMKQPRLIEGRTHVINASVLCEPMFAQRGDVLKSSDAAEQSKRYSNQCIEAVKPLESSSIGEFKKFGDDLKNNAENRIEYLERYWGIFTIFDKDQEKVDAIDKEIRDVAEVIQPPDFEKLSRQYDSQAAFESLKEIIAAKRGGESS